MGRWGKIDGAGWRVEAKDERGYQVNFPESGPQPGSYW